MNRSRIPLPDLLRRGVQAQQAGQLAQAEVFYRQVLQQQPEQPDALQLLGLVAGRVGNLPVAEDLMRRSLRARPAQPHVWNNLGNQLQDQARFEEALGCYAQALALNAKYIDAHYNQARALRSAGRLPEAEAAVRRALSLAPQPTAAMLQLLAQIEDDEGNLAAALNTLDHALRLAPDRLALLHNRATVLQRLHRHAEALAAHERALALGLDAADAHYNYGNTLQSLGRLEDATQAYCRALSLEPCHRLALYDLARLRWRRAEPGFDAELLAAEAAHPASPVAPAVRGQLLLRAERHEQAAEAFAAAVRRGPDMASHHDGLGQALARLGQFDAALAAHARAVALMPQDPSIRTNQASTMLMAGLLAEAAAAAQAACELSPLDQNAWALKGLAWRLLGDPREAWLNGPQWIQAVDLPVPHGHASMEAFNTALAAELRALHHDRAAPVDQTLRQGTQTFGDIFEQGHPHVDAIKCRIAEAIDLYLQSLPSDAAHPLLSRRAGSWRFCDSWSSRLARGGFHTHHVHPHGWISAVYYVAVPQCVDRPSNSGPRADDSREGWLQLGQSNLGLGPLDVPSQFVQPKAGRLALFPSYVWHGTVPFHEDAERLTIAFDIVPRSSTDPEALRPTNVR